MGSLAPKGSLVSVKGAQVSAIKVSQNGGKTVVRVYNPTEKPVTVKVELLRRPTLNYDELAEIDENRQDLPRGVRMTAEISIKYEGYIKRQIAEVNRKARLEEKKIPEDIDYSAVKGLRLEAIQKLTKVRPLTIGQASRISGVSPADISVLMIYIGIV